MTTHLRAAILIVSDTASKDPSTDKCEEVLRQVFTNPSTATTVWKVEHVKIVPDDVLEIQRIVTGWTDGGDAINLVVTSGGTGFATKDVTPEAVAPLIHKHASGLVHGMLATSLAVTPFAIMARPVAGVRHGTIILTLPGSPKGAKENLEAVMKLMAHACQQAAGGDSRALHSGGTKKLEQDAGISASTGQNSHHDHSHSHHHHHEHSHGHSHGHGHKIPKPHTKPGDRPKPNDPSAGLIGRQRESPYPMITVDEALGLIAANVPSPIIVIKPLTQSLIGSVLATDVKARESVPAFRASIVDGYAVVTGGDAPSIKGVWPVVGSSTAQAGQIKQLKAGQITRITTGAPLPEGATAVVMVEDTVLKSATDDGKEEKEVQILTADISPGENVREVGSDVAASDIVLRKGEGITGIGGEFGLLASVGTREVSVYHKPVVGVMSTGDEIVPHDQDGDLRYGEVRDTNRPTLLQAIKNTGFESVDLGIASDKVGALEEKLREAMRACDVVITTGGVSMGELDLLKPTIERQLDGTIHFGRVSMKPGKPTTFATVPFKTSDGQRTTKVIFSLPGNPASAVVTYHLFVLPALHAMAGIAPVGLPSISAMMDERVRCDPKRQEYARAVVTCSASGIVAQSTGGQRSSRIGSFKGANGLIILPLKGGFVEKGEQTEGITPSCNTFGLPLSHLRPPKNFKMSAQPRMAAEELDDALPPYSEVEEPLACPQDPTSNGDPVPARLCDMSQVVDLLDSIPQTFDKTMRCRFADYQRFASQAEPKGYPENRRYLGRRGDEGTVCNTVLKHSDGDYGIVTSFWVKGTSITQLWDRLGKHRREWTSVNPCPHVTNGPDTPQLRLFYPDTPATLSECLPANGQKPHSMFWACPECATSCTSTMSSRARATVSDFGRISVVEFKVHLYVQHHVGRLQTPLDSPWVRMVVVDTSEAEAESEPDLQLTPLGRLRARVRELLNGHARHGVCKRGECLGGSS